MNEMAPKLIKFPSGILPMGNPCLYKLFPGLFPPSFFRLFAMQSRDGDGKSLRVRMKSESFHSHPCL